MISGILATPRISQMIKVIHYDFLTGAEAMTFVFSSTEKNQAWNLMPSFVTELVLRATEENELS
tara:strand:+ start:1119 stop:1310 length:192 start_codon:yes stop_codon:yes gene_type:complete